MGNPLVILIPTVVVFGAALLGWLDAPRAARKRAGKLAAGTGLAVDDETRGLVERRLRRRQRAMMFGLFVGSIIGNVPAVLAAAEFGSLTAWWMAMCMAATGVGALTVHVIDSGRTAAEPGSRAAVLKPRRLRDFMYPVETVAPYVALLLPALAALLAVTSIGTGEAADAQRWSLLAGAAIAIIVTVAVVLGQRFVLHMAPPADSPGRLKWEDALRGIALRDLGTTACWISFALGGLAAYGGASNQLTGYPPALMAVTQIAAAIGLVAMVALVVAESSTSPARRFLRLYEAGQR